MPKLCAICGQPLPPKRTRYCSEACANEDARRLARQRGGEKARPKPYRWITCPDCGAEVYVHVKSKRCRDCQAAANNRHNLEHKRRKAAGKTRLLGSTDLCERCGRPYTVDSGLQRYCPDCAPVAVAENDRAASRAWNRERYADADARAEKNRKRRAVKPYPKICPICSKPFQAANLKQICCSDACNQTRMRQYWHEYDQNRRRHRPKIKEDVTMIKHIYGQQPTALILTDKAERYYAGEEMTIFEHEDRVLNLETDRMESVYTYSYIMSDTGRPTLSGGPESPRMTADELNAELESMAGQDI